MSGILGDNVVHISKWDHYVVNEETGKFEHVTPEYYNPYFDPPQRDKHGNLKKVKYGDEKWLWR